MISAPELRIGNLVYHNEGWSAAAPINFEGVFVLQWEERHWYMIGECTLSLDMIDPIPLTADWLIRFGFEEDEYGATDSTEYFGKLYRHPSEFLVCTRGINAWHYVDIDEDKFYSFISVQLTYVHQLQNLHFCLTNTELTLK